jgi:hypothetical protein
MSKKVRKSQKKSEKKKHILTFFNIIFEKYFFNYLL